MAKGVYVGVGGVARKAKKIYAGADGKARKVKKGYIGVGGVARPFFKLNSVPVLYGKITSPTTVPGSAGAATVANNAVFAGGYHKSDLKEVFKYDKTLTLSYLADLSFPRRPPAYGDTDSCCFFACGIKSGSATELTNSVEVYNTSLVQTIQKFRNSFKVAGAGVRNGFLLAGGSQRGDSSSSNWGDNTVYMYDNTLVSRQLSLYGGALAPKAVGHGDEHILVCGGQSRESRGSTVIDGDSFNVISGVKTKVGYLITNAAVNVRENNTAIYHAYTSTDSIKFTVVGPNLVASTINSGLATPPNYAFLGSDKAPKCSAVAAAGHVLCFSPYTYWGTDPAIQGDFFVIKISPELIISSEYIFKNPKSGHSGNATAMAGDMVVCLSGTTTGGTEEQYAFAYKT